MKIFFLLKLINFSKINTTNIKDIDLNEKLQFLEFMNFGHYILYKNFENKKFEEFLNLPIDKKNLENKFQQKRYLILYNATSKKDYLTYSDFMYKILLNQENIFEYITINNRIKFEKIKSNIEAKKIYISLESFKNMFSHSDYFEKIEKLDFEKFIASKKKYELSDFVDMLNLDDEKIIGNLKSGKFKETTKPLCSKEKIYKIAAKNLENIILEYEKAIY